MKSNAIHPLALAATAIAVGCGGQEPAPSGGPAPPFASMEVSAMSLRHVSGRPYEVGHTLPLHFTLKGNTPNDQDHLSVEVQALVSLVEVSTAPVASRRRCEVGAQLLNVPLDGRAVSFEEPLVIPTACAPAGAAMADFNVEVQIVVGSRTDADTAPPGFKFTYLFDAASVANADLPASACRLNGSESERCSPTLRLAPSAGFHLVNGIRPMSSVGVIWPRTMRAVTSPMNAPPRDPAEIGPASMTDTLRSNLDVELETRSFGGSPNHEADEDERLPGPVAVSFALAPTVGEHSSEYQAIPFRTRPIADEPERASLTFERLPTGARDTTRFHLFLPQAVETLMTTGAWAGDDRYTLKVCETPMGWAEDDDEDDDDPELVQGTTNPDANHCRTVNVRFARSLAATTNSAVRHEPLNFDRTWSASDIGGGRLQARYLIESNSARHGAELLVRPSVSFRSYNRDLLEFDLSAWAEPGPNYAAGRARAKFAILGFTVKEENLTLGVQNGDFSRTVSVQLPPIRKEFAYEQQFMLGPVPVTARISLGGALTSQGTVGFDGGVPHGGPGRNNGIAAFTRFTPSIALVATVSAAVGTRWVSAGVRGTVNLAELSFPITGTGFTTWAPATPGTVFGGANMDIRAALQFLAGRLELFVKVDPPGPGSKTFTKEICSWSGLSGFGSASSPRILLQHGEGWVQVR